MAEVEKIEILNDKASKKELELSLQEIKRIRESYSSLTDSLEKQQLLTELYDRISALEEEVDKSFIDTISKKEKEKSIDDQISDLSNDLENEIKAYDNCSRKMNVLLQEEEKVFNRNSFREEDLAAFQRGIANLKLSINQESFKRKVRIDEDKKLIAMLRNRNLKEESFKLEDKVPKMENYSDESHESLLDFIECLYLVHDSFERDSKDFPRNIVIRSNQLETILFNADSIPQKIKGVEKNSNYIPDKAPSDLENVSIHYQEDFTEPYVLENSKEQGIITPERILLLYNTDENSVYVDSSLIERFHLIPIEEKMIIGKGLYYRIQEKDVTYLFENQNNDYSPYIVEKEDFTFPKESEKEEVSFDTILLFRKREEDGSEHIYATLDVLRRFGVFPHEGFILLDNIPYYHIREADLNKIHSIASLAADKIRIQYQNLSQQEEKKEEAISSTYIPSNIHAAKSFVEELKTGEMSYNIIHSIPTHKRASLNLLQYLTDSFNGTSIMNEYEEWLNQLSEKDFQLFLKKNSTFELLSTLNYKILEKIKFYILKELELKEDLLHHNYLILFHTMGLIKSLEEKLTSPSIDRAEATADIMSRRTLLEEANKCIHEILTAREEMDNLIGNDVLVNKVVLNKQYPYVGMKYKKEISPEFISYRNECLKQLELSVEDKNYEGVISNFMKLEGFYYDDMETTMNSSNSRSVGFQYYPILANQFHFKNDSMALCLVKSEASSIADMKAIKKMRLQDIKRSHLLGNRQEDLWKDFDMNHWQFDSYTDVFDDLRKTTIQYEDDMISEKEVLLRIESYVDSLKRYLINTVNEMMDSLREYAISHPQLDIDSIQEKLEHVIVHPEEICKYDVDRDDILLRLDLPEEMLSTLISAATALGFMDKIYQSVLKEKQNLKENVR